VCATWTLLKCSENSSRTYTAIEHIRRPSLCAIATVADAAAFSVNEAIFETQLDSVYVISSPLSTAINVVSTRDASSSPLPHCTSLYAGPTSFLANRGNGSAYAYHMGCICVSVCL